MVGKMGKTKKHFFVKIIIIRIEGIIKIIKTKHKEHK